MISFLFWACVDQPDFVESTVPPREPIGRPSILLITIDTTRADYLEPYGAPVAMPVYSRLAEEGTLFLRAYSPYPLTIPSHATIFTGKTPPAHGVRDNGEFILGEAEVTLAERFEQVGYTTAAFTSAFPTQAHWGFGQGFSIYHDPLERRPNVRDWRDERIAEDVVSDTINMLDEVHGPLFLWVHLFDAHWPYDPPQPWATIYADNPYLGEIVYASDQVGRLIEWWDRKYVDSVVVLTSDHGEGLGEGGEETHGFLLHDATIRVPLILRGSGVPKGQRLADPVGLVDIAPTILDISGIAGSDEMEGSNLFEGGSSWVYSESLLGQRSLGLASLYSHTDSDGRLTRGSFDRFYPVVDDTISLEGSEGKSMSNRQQQLKSVVDSATTGETTAMDSESIQRLMALGYLSGVSSNTSGDLDPRDVIDIIPLTWQARQKIAVGDLQQAAKLIQALKIRMPEALGIQQLEAQFYLASGRLMEALELFKGLHSGEPSSTISLQIADIYSQLGLWTEAFQWYILAFEMYPNNARIMHRMVDSLMQVGDYELAREYAEDFLAIHPDHDDIRLIYADFMLLENRFDDAINEVSVVLKASPHSAKALAVFSRALWMKGESDQAIDILQESLRLNPFDFGVRLTLAAWLNELDRFAESLRFLGPAIRLLPERLDVQRLYSDAQRGIESQR